MTANPEHISAALESTDLGDRLRAVNQLRELAPDIAYGFLKRAIADSNSRVRYAAVSQLTSLGTQNQEEAKGILLDRLYHDSEMDVQSAAADAIGALKLTEAFPDLEKRYHDCQDWLLRMSIVATLGELGDPRSLDLLQEALGAAEVLIQAAAISSLGELKEPKTVAWILPFVGDEDWQVRFRVAQALANIGGPDAQAALETLAQDEFDQVAEAAKQGL